MDNYLLSCSSACIPACLRTHMAPLLFCWLIQAAHTQCCLEITDLLNQVIHAWDLHPRSMFWIKALQAVQVDFIQMSRSPCTRLACMICVLAYLPLLVSHPLSNITFLGKRTVSSGSSGKSLEASPPRVLKVVWQSMFVSTARKLGLANTGVKLANC